MSIKYQISASLMCADLTNLEREIKKLEKAGVDYLHIDIMDGHFVPNLTFGPDFVKKVRKISKLPLDIHLMVEKPENFINLWETKRNDIITFHIEATNHPQRLLAQIKKEGLKGGIALNPGTPLTSIFYLLPDLDLILIMTVNPGFAGQRWIPATLGKLKRLQKIIQNKPRPEVLRGKIQVEVDGNIGKHNIPLLQKAGANIFVGGSSSIFASPYYSKNTWKMRQIIKNI